MEKNRPSLPRNDSFYNYPADNSPLHFNVYGVKDDNHENSTDLNENSMTNMPNFENDQSDSSSLENEIFKNLSRSRNATLRWNLALKETIENMPSRTLPRSFMGKNHVISSITSGVAPEYSLTALKNDANNIAEKMEKDTSFMENNPESSLLRKQTLREMPHGLTVKRLVKNRLTKSIGKNSKQKSLSFFKRMKYKGKIQLIKLINWYKNLMVSFELWYSSLKMIEGNFGSGVATYFRFMRWFFLLDFFLAIPAVGFIVIPQILYSIQNNYGSDNNATLVWHDIFSGENYFTRTILFYGHYTNETISLVNNYYYKMPPAYFFTMLCLYIAIFLVVSLWTALSYRQSFIVTKGGLQNIFAQKVFCGWDFNIATKEAAELKSSALYNELKELLSDTKDDNQKRSCYEITWKWLMQISINLGTLLLLLVIGYVVWILLEENKINIESEEQKTRVAFIIAIVINISVLLLPILFGYLTRFENYSSQSTAFNITLVRVFLLELTIVGVLLTFWLTYSVSNNCWETSLGQEIYRLILFDFFISVIISSMLEALRYIYDKACRGKNGLAEFDIARHSFQIIYNQTLLWVGFFFSPLIPFIVTVKLWLTWYIRIFCTMKFCKPYTKSWRAAQTGTLYYILTFLTLFLTLIFFGYVISQVDASNCGPFRHHSYIYETLTVDAFNLGTESFFWNIVIFFTKPAVVVIIVVATCITAYFLRAKAIAQQKMVKVLRKMLVISAKDREFLLNYISKVTSEQYRHPSRNSNEYDDASVDKLWNFERPEQETKIDEISSTKKRF